MQNDNTIEKIFKKAIKNGWRLPLEIELVDMPPQIYYLWFFRHDFAIAFWGEGKKSLKMLGYSWKDDGVEIWNPQFKRWEYHLRKMVLEEDPLKYLEKFI